MIRLHLPRRRPAPAVLDEIDAAVDELRIATARLETETAKVRAEAGRQLQEVKHGG